MFINVFWTNASNAVQDWDVPHRPGDFTLQQGDHRLVRYNLVDSFTFQITVKTHHKRAHADVHYDKSGEKWTLEKATADDFELDPGKKNVTVKCFLTAGVELGDNAPTFVALPVQRGGRR